MSKKDIFISYRNDGSGNQFAARLCRDLEEMGYSVSFNPHEAHADNFPERLRNAISDCTDFILVLSRDCLERLRRDDNIDWVREELLTAWQQKKHILPILMDGVSFPERAEDMPEALRFLPHIDALKFPPDEYMESPFGTLTRTLYSKQDGKDANKDSFNSNPDYNVTEDFITAMEKAQSGDPEAMYEAGMMCFYGAASETGEKACWNFRQAAYWLKRVAGSDSHLSYHARSTLGRMYYQGIIPGEAQSYEKAFDYHRSAAQADTYSANDTAFMMRIGLGCEFDFDAIISYYENNVLGRGDDMAALSFANFLESYGRYDEAIRVYDSLAVVSPEANYQIGLLYKKGVHCNPPKPDYVQAAYYLRNAADSNHHMAAFEYGLMCFRPTGRFKKDFVAAEKYLRLAADGGVAAAQYVLGFMYRSGHVGKDYDKAVMYLEMARQQGHSLASLELAALYQQPECRNYERAYQCACIAASHGVAEGELVLGNMLFWGRGCQADIDKAYDYYSRAYAHGFYYASVMMRKIDEIREAK